MAFSKWPRHNLSPFCSPQEEANSAVMMDLFPASRGNKKHKEIVKRGEATLNGAERGLRWVKLLSCRRQSQRSDVVSVSFIVDYWLDRTDYHEAGTKTTVLGHSPARHSLTDTNAAHDGPKFEISWTITCPFESRHVNNKTSVRTGKQAEYSKPIPAS